MAWIVARARRRLARGEPLRGPLAKADPTPEERDALEAFLGRRPSGGAALTVRLSDIDARLRASEICAGLDEAMALLAGPVEDERGARERAEAAWAALLAGAAEALAGVPFGAPWLNDLESSGLLRRLARGELAAAGALLGAAVGLVRRLPVEGVPIAELAATAAGDSHALDAGEPLGTLVVRFAARWAGLSAWNDAEQRREAWAAVGVLQDELSGPVLVLNLRPSGGGGAWRAMSVHADEGEPYRLSLRQLVRGRPAFSTEITGRVVFACENPTVVAAAAARLGARCAPLVCVEGNPRVPARLLISRLCEAGIEVAYHGDFDWAGVQIGNRIVGRLGARPWRFGREEYLAAATAGARLAGEPVEAVWDGGLCEAMREAGVAVHEERVLDALCADLATAGR